MADATLRVTADVRQAEQALRSLDSAIGDAAKTMAKITAAAAAVGYALSRAVANVSALKDMSVALGVSAQNLRYLQQSAALAGVGADELNSSLMKLQNNIGTALIQRTGPAADALKALGINLSDISKLSPDQQFQAITNQLSRIPDPAQRASLAMDLLGKQGPRLVEAAKALDQVRQRTEQLGLALSDLDIETIDQVGDKFDELRFIVSAGIEKALANLAPYIIALINQTERAIQSIKNNADSWLLVAKAVGAVVAAILAYRTYVVAQAIINGILAMASAFIKVYEGIKLATTAMEVLNAVVGKNPLVKLASVVISLGAMFVATKAATSAFKDLDKEAANVRKQIEDGMKKASAATAEVVVQTNNLTKEQQKAADAAQQAFGRRVADMTAEAQLLEATNQGRGKQAEIEKIISDERTKLLEKYSRMTPLQEKELRTAAQRLQFAKDENNYYQLALQQRIAGLDLQARLGQSNLDQERVAAAVEKARIAAGLSWNKQKEEEYYLGEQNNIITEKQLAIERAINEVLGERVVYQRDGLFISNETIKGIERIKNVLTPDSNQRLLQLDSLSLADAYKALNQKLIADNASMLEAIQSSTTKSEEEKLNLMSVENEIFQAKLLDLQKRYEMAKAQLDQEAIQRSYETENAILNAKLYAFQQEEALYQKRKELRAMEIYEEIKQNNLLYANQVFNEDQLKQIARERAEFEKKTSMEQTQFALQQGATVFNALGAQNKKAFELAKAFNIANAVMNTYMGATKALATYPPPFNFIAAAAVVASGLAQVAQIRSQKYSGRAVGGPMVGGQGYLVGERGPEIFRPGTAGTMIPNNQIGGSPVTVNFNITANDTTGFDELITSRRGLITSIIADAQLEQGRR